MGFYEDKIAEAKERNRKRQEDEKEKLRATAMDMADNPTDGGKLAINLDLDITNKDKQDAKEILSNDAKMEDISNKQKNNVDLAVSEKFAQALAHLSPSALAMSLGGKEGMKSALEIGKNKADVLVKQASIMQRSAGSITPYQQASLSLRREEVDLHRGKEQRLGEHFGWKKGENKLKRKEKFAQHFTTDVVVKNLRQAVVAGQSALELIQTGTPLGDKSVRVAVARLVGDVGRLSDFDIKQYTGNMSAARRASRMLREWYDGNLPKQDREEFGVFISKVLTTKQNQLSAETQVWSKRAAKMSDGEISEKEAMELLQPSSMVNPKERMNDTPTGMFLVKAGKDKGLIKLKYANGQELIVTKKVAKQLTQR